jgi:hypothetical protein
VSYLLYLFWLTLISSFSCYKLLSDTGICFSCYTHVCLFRGNDFSASLCGISSTEKPFKNAHKIPCNLLLLLQFFWRRSQMTKKNNFTVVKSWTAHIFPNIQEPSQNSKHHKGDINQSPNRGSTNRLLGATVQNLVARDLCTPGKDRVIWKEERAMLT